MKKKYLIPILLFGSWFPAGARTWTYSQCVEYARENNISFRKSKLNEQTAAYNLEESKAQWQPSLDFTTSHTYTNSPWGAPVKNSYNGNIGLSSGWTVWNGGVRENNIKRDKLQIEINRLASSALFRTIETDLLQVYLNILYAKESVNIYSEAVKVSKAQAERAKQLMEAGKLSRVDYAQINSQYEQDKYALVNAQGTYDSRRMELKQLLELGIDDSIDISDVEWTANQVLTTLPPIEESFDMALDTDVQIKQLEKENEATDYDIKIAQAGKAPIISLNAGVGTGYYAPGNSLGEGLKQAWNEHIGVSLSLPVFDNKKTKTAVARAKVQKEDAMLDISKRNTEIAQLVEQWYIDTRTAQSRYSAGEEQLEAARLSDDLTNEKFMIGYVNPVELLTSHNSLIEAQHSLLQAKYMAMLGQKMIEYYRTAKVSLN